MFLTKISFFQSERMDSHSITVMAHLPATTYPPPHLSLDIGVIIYTRMVSHIYDLSLKSSEGQHQFLGRIEEKSDHLWAVTFTGCDSCIPEYFDDWQQATVFLSQSFCP